MFKKMLTAVLILVVLATAVGVIPSFAENAAFACPAGDPSCNQ